MIAALDRARPGIARQSAPLLGSPPPSFEGLVTALINQLAAQPGQGEVLLVLDDYHLIDAPPVHASLGFLLETSVLERLSGALYDAVTGRPGGQAMLERVERANLFLVPLDEVRGWWRYHHLFADLLRARLQAERPERVPALHRAAAAWSDAHGLADDTVSTSSPPTSTPASNTSRAAPSPDEPTSRRSPSNPPGGTTSSSAASCSTCATARSTGFTNTSTSTPPGA